MTQNDGIFALHTHIHTHTENVINYLFSVCPKKHRDNGKSSQNNFFHGILFLDR